MELGTRSARLDRVARVMLLPRSPNDGIGAQRRLNGSCADTCFRQLRVVCGKRSANSMNCRLSVLDASRAGGCS